MFANASLSDVAHGLRRLIQVQREEMASLRYVLMNEAGPRLRVLLCDGTVAVGVYDDGSSVRYAHAAGVREEDDRMKNAI